MALQKSQVAIDLTSGLDTKSDDKAMVPGKLTTMENAEVVKRNKLQKRDGYTALPAVDVDGAALTGGTGLAVYNNQLLRFKDGVGYSLSEAADAWVSVGNISPCLSEITRISSRPNTNIESYLESAAIGDYLMYAHSGRIAIHDLPTGVDIESLAIADSASTSIVKCLTLGTKLIAVAYIDGEEKIKAYVFDTDAPTSGISAATDIVTGLTGGSAQLRGLDAIGDDDNSRIWIAYHHAVNGVDIKWVEVNSSLSAVNTSTITEAASSLCYQFSIVRESTTSFYVFYLESNSGNYRYFVQNSSNTAVLGATTVMSAGNFGSAITGIDDGASGVTFVGDNGTDNNDERVIQTGTVNSSGVSTAATDLVRGLTPCSDIITYGGKNYIRCIHQNSTNSTIIWINIADGEVIARSLSGQVVVSAGGSNTLSPEIASVVNPSSGIFYSLAQEYGELTGSYKISLCKLDFTNTEIHSAQLNDSLLIAGAVPKIYDGKKITEAGFHVAPRLEITATATTGGFIADGVYQFLAVYEWADRTGKIHRSAPSAIVSQTISSGTGTNKISGQATTYRFTDKSNVQVAIYRTEANGSTFYRTALQSNSLTSDYTTAFNSTVADATLISNVTLYTTGGVLENFAPVSCKYVTAYKNRLFLGGLDIEGVVWYSQENSTNLPVEFSSDLTITIDNNGRRLKGLETLDDKLIAFKEDRYFFTYGDGPASTGFGGTFAPFQAVNTDVGVADSKSIVAVPLGLMMKSKKGWYLIDSSLVATYVGDMIEEFNGQTVTSAALSLTKNRVRFTTEDSRLIEYDFYFQQWYTQTNLDAYDSLVWGDKYVVLRKTSADVVYETADLYTDASVDYLMKMETGWLSLAGLVHYQRIYKLFIVGERKASHSFKVSVAYDHSDTYEDTVTLTPDTLLDDGSSGYYPYRLEVKLKKQKCQAIRFKFEEVSPAGTKQSFTITAVGLEIGTKRGMAKIRSAQSRGTS